MTMVAQPKTPAKPVPITPVASGAKPRCAIVIGGGLAGLASAVELASHGVGVTIVERNAHLGGKMNVLSERGYTFDMGPTIITLPQVLRGIIRRSGRRPEDWINLVNLDPQWRCHYEDGVVIDLRRKLADTITGLEKQFPGKGAGRGFESFVEYSRRMLRLSEKVFFYRDLGGVLDMMFSPPKDPGLLGDVLAMRMYSTVGATVHKHIAEPHARQMCEHFLQYVGSSPFLAPAILSLIAACQTDHGCWYPLGGTRMVARALAEIAREQGIDVRLGVGVSKINHEGGKARGVTLDDGTVLRADVVISNCDVQRTNRELLDTPGARGEARAIARAYTPACSGVVLYLGLSRRYEHLAHHNFLFSKDSHAEFSDIYGAGIPARDPTIYLAAPSRSDPEQAPPGHEALYALIHTPFARPDHQWEGAGGQLERYRPVILDKLKRFGMRDIEEHIVVDRWLTPNGIERLYNAEGGAIYGLASHGKLKGGFKPRNRSRVLKGLYLAGGSVNPGPGVPMVLMSGVTAARAACQDLGVHVDDAIALGEGVEV